MLREQREAAGLTQQQLAHAAGVSRRTIAAIEAGESIPRTETWIRIANALGVEPEVSEIAEDDGVFWEIEHRGCVTRCEPYWGDE